MKQKRPFIQKGRKV